MSFKRLFLFTILSAISIGLFSCTETEEQTNVSFKWNYVKRVLKDSVWVIETSESFVVDEYYTYKDTSSLSIVGYTTSDDSIFMTINNNLKKGSDKSISEFLTVGDYFHNNNQFNFNLAFFRKGVLIQPKVGLANLKVRYLNSRIVFDFNSNLNDGYGLEGGIGDNLNVYLPKDTTATK